MRKRYDTPGPGVAQRFDAGNIGGADWLVPGNHFEAVRILVGDKGHGERQISFCHQAVRQGRGVGTHQRGLQSGLPVDIEQDEFIVRGGQTLEQVIDHGCGGDGRIHGRL